MASKVPLDKLIGMAITDKEKFNETMREIEKSLDTQDEILTLENARLNVGFIKTKLEDIIQHQFPEHKRYLVELVQNGLDARASRIDISIGNGVRTITDDGSGMSIKELVKNLTIPFYTEKDGVTTIGRFGLGFFSTLKELYTGYKVRVSTKKDTGYVATYTLEKGNFFVKFDAYENSIRGTKIEILPDSQNEFSHYAKILEKKRGEILPEEFSLKDAQKYLQGFLKYIQLQRCRISLNDRLINTGLVRDTPYIKSYEIPFEGDKIFVTVNFDVDPREAKAIDLVGGIKVKDHDRTYDIVINYPLSFKLTEARDRIDLPPEKLGEVKQKIFREAVLPYMKEHKKLAKIYGRFDDFISNVLRSGTAVEYAKTANEDELKYLIELKTGKKPSRSLVLADSNLKLLFSDYYLIESSDLSSTMINALCDNPYVLKPKSFTTERFPRHKLSDKEIEKYSLEASVGDFDAAFVELGPYTSSPYGFSIDTLYINKNHIVFKLDDSASRSAKNWFLLNSLLGPKTTEYLILTTYLGEEAQRRL